MELQLNPTNTRTEDSINGDSPNYGRIVFIFIKYIIFSILIVHLFGLFGIFISLAYPLVWFFIPSRVFCFYCLHQRVLHKDHGYCRACKREVTTIYNPTARSMIINMFSIFFMSLVFLIIIAVEFTFIGQFTGTVLNSGNSASFISPSVSKSYNVAKPFYFDIVINATDQAINLVKSDISFDNTILEVKEIDTTKSFANIFSNKEFSNKDGTIRIVGGLTSPGFIGEEGLFARIYFNPIKPGAGKIQIEKTSKILANDGVGTNILNEYIAFPVTIEP